MASGQYRVDDDVAQLIKWLQEKEAARGNPGLSEKKALNWMAREGARAMKLATPVARKGERGRP